MRKKLLIIIVLVLSIFMICCNKSVEKGDSGFSYNSISESISGVKTGEYVPREDASHKDSEYKESYDISDGEKTSKEEIFVEPEEPIEGNYQSGQLTSSALFDNDDFDFWKSLLSSGQTKDGVFKNLYDEYSFKTYNRVSVTLEDVAGATVVLDNEFTGVTNANGLVYLFNKEYKYNHTIKISYIDENDQLVNLEKTFEGDSFTINKDDLVKAKEKEKRIELMFVIDTTGSMGDEIYYLKAEIEDVIQRIENSNEGVTIYLALLFYRDSGDEYVTKYFDFTTDIETQKNNLSLQSAAGGGDFPEDVSGALELANKQQWSTGSATRIIIHVADAPDHENAINKWNNEVLELAKKGIRIITVASSGIDKPTEYYFRSEALLTNGCYGYLTDDSGIGYGHIEATSSKDLPVEYLNAMLVRLVNGFYTGTFAEPVQWKGQE